MIKATIPQPRLLWWEGFEVDWLAKAAGDRRTGVKYTRRVFLGTDPKTGRRKYRYYYSEASLAHRVRQGERINLGDAILDVLDVRGSKIRVRDQHGQEKTIHLAELHQEIFAVYRDKMIRGAQRVAARWGRVAARRQDLPERQRGAAARRLWEQHRKKLARTKADENTARHLVAFLVGRRGWADGARDALLEITQSGLGVADVAAGLKQIARAAENLSSADGAGAVGPVHVVEAARHRLGSGEDFPDRWTELKNRLAEQNAATDAALRALEATVATAQRVPAAMLAYVRGAVRMDAGVEAQRLAQAFPAVRLDEDLRTHQNLQSRFRRVVEQAEVGPSGIGADGAESTVYIADAEGFPQPRTIRYRLIEADELVASHDPNNFKPHPNYPEGVQERVYHRDRAEQDKVRGNADRFRPELIHNTNPDAVNGAPVVTADGIVLGGNSRTMTMQILYGRGEGGRVKDHLAENAYQFGLSTAQVEGMRQPILVRALDDVSSAETPKDELKDLVRRANETFTQGMDPRTAQVAKAQRINDSVIARLSDGMKPEQTLNAFLSANTKAAREFVAALGTAGIIDRRNRSQYVRADGRLNQDGRSYVERLLVGKMVPDSELLSELSLPTMSKLARSAPSILAAAGAGDKHDLTGDLRIAMRTMVEMRYRDHGTLDEHLRQMHLRSGEDEIVPEPEIRNNPRAQELFHLVEGSSATKVAKIMRRYAAAAKEDSSAHVGGGLFGEDRSSVDVLRASVAQSARRGGTEVADKSRRFVFTPPAAPSPGIALLEQLYKGDGDGEGDSDSDSDSDGDGDSDGAIEKALADLLVVKGGGHKYIRRIATGDPKRPWRYVYKDGKRDTKDKGKRDAKDKGKRRQLETAVRSAGLAGMLDKAPPEGQAAFWRAMAFDDDHGRATLELVGMTHHEVLAKMAEAQQKLSALLKGGDSKGRHTDAEGNYSAERMALHEQVAESFVAGGEAAAPGETPEMLITGGYPGSGKSSMLKQYPGGTSRFVHLDSDEIKKALAKADGIDLEDGEHGHYAAYYHEEADAVMDLVRVGAQEQRKHILIDGTMKTGHKAENEVRVWREAGYSVDVAFADLPLEKAMHRAAGRFLRGGRYVPLDYIASHGRKNIASLERIKPLVDSWSHWNTDVPFGTRATMVDSG